MEKVNLTQSIWLGTEALPHCCKRIYRELDSNILHSVFLLDCWRMASLDMLMLCRELPSSRDIFGPKSTTAKRGQPVKHVFRMCTLTVDSGPDERLFSL